MILLRPELVSAQPPFGGTIFIDPDIITSADPTTFVESNYAGTGLRTMFDRRVNNWVEREAFLFDATYSDGLTIEIQVNPEFGSVEAAREKADFYAEVFGRLPYDLRVDVRTSWIHMGDEAFGGGNNNLLIHTGSLAQSYIDGGILEETLVHEAAHTSLDAAHANAAGWLAAQQADGEFISTYARDNPTREDIAESFLPYLAIRHRADRISMSLYDTIVDTIPNRIAYFDSLGLNLSPIEATPFRINPGLNDAWYNPATNGQGFFITVFPQSSSVFLAWFTYDTVRPVDGGAAVLGEPGHRWITAQGPFDGDTAQLTVFITRGGVFDQPLPMPMTDQAGDGSMTIEWADCTQGLLTYAIDSLGISGDIPIERIAPDNVALCESLQ